MRNYRIISKFPLLLLIILCSCAHYERNRPLVKTDHEYNFDTFARAHDADKTFIALCFTGGGTRSAALSYGVLDKLRKVKIKDSQGIEKNLLEEVDLISTVSGGSFTGAYYALYGERLFKDFKSKFLYQNIERDLTLNLLNPLVLARLASPYYDRIDMAAEMYNKILFDSQTFATLASNPKTFKDFDDIEGRPMRPFLIINATNMYTGNRFEFTGDQFGYINSDILSYPISRAVAASSAFPILLSPITLVNYSDPAEFKMTIEDKLAMKDYWINRGRYRKSANNLIYSLNPQEHPYLHLMDGGLADNIGLRAVMDLYLYYGILQKINNREMRRFLVIVVNAFTQEKENDDLKERAPLILDVAYKTGTTSMDNYSYETVEWFKYLVDENNKANEISGDNFKYYVAELTFDDLPDKDERNFFKYLPTTFYLPVDTVDRLIDVGGKLLDENPDFQAFLKEYPENIPAQESPSR